MYALTDNMVRMPNAFCYDFWQQEPSGPTVLIDCLMPNGVIIPLEVNRDAVLQEVKEDLWEEAAKYPLHGTLRDITSYNFSCINSMAENEELMDENRRLCDVKPFSNVLKVVEHKGDKAEHLLNAQISLLIGKGLHDFEGLKNPEVNDCRWKMKVLVDEMAKERQNKSWLEKVQFQFPPRLASSPEFPEALRAKLKDSNLIVLIKFENMEATFTVSVPHTMSVHQVIVLVLYKKSLNFNTFQEHPADFALKVVGREEYLLGDDPIGRFLYVQETVAREETPVLVVVAMNSIPVESDNPYENPEDLEMKRNKSFSTLTLRKRGKFVSSWTIEEQFSFRVNAVCKLNCDSQVEVVVEAGLFHGGKSLCESQKTRSTMASEGHCNWEEDLQMDLRVCNLPRMARLCLVAYEVTKSAKGVRARKMRDSKLELYVNPLAWVNTTVYDFRNQLKTGAVTLYMWTYAEDAQSDDLLHPLGTVVSHPNVDHATALTITFHRYHIEHTVVYPSTEKMVELASDQGEDTVSMAYGTPLSGKLYLEQLHLLSERDPLHEMHEQEKKLVWSMRDDCLYHVPTLLPKLLDCVEWNDHREVAQATALLQRWPKLPVHKALELLDYAYADQGVRSFAVECLRDISDEELSLYLLQLVQALKHESYLYCDLVEFLIRRALTNQKIGHYLFWHLRSEMHVPSVSVRFGLILEAYCRGNQEHMKILMRQKEALNKLQLTTELVRQRRDKEKGKAFLRDYLAENHCTEALSNILNPLDPSYRLKRLRFEKCGVMDSKMRPLWMVFENDDAYGSDIFIIYKNGDDLRQDMLTLQMIRIMDKLWKEEGLDLRMNPYGCISTDYRVGLIDVVLNAETIANIQKEKGMFSATCAFRKGSLLAWLKDHNLTESSLRKAIEDFTLSCAGYCVATYVLGIADRHSDNIMVKRSGQLFHIDFGHILGHFKEKFGFRRERVPFVLTHDFVYVITKGQARKEAPEFERFQKCCEQAFLVLRRHGSFILSLFAMMISTGLPELSSEKDLNYLRDTLVLDLTEQEALKHFQSKFDEALRNSWKTSINWASHNLVKNNKT